MDKEQILTKIQDCGIVAVVRAESADRASRIADACIEGGVAAIELTFTVPHADKVIEELAKRANMAPTTFHRHFRKVTSVSPIQYQKNLRLHEGKRLMIAENEPVAEAAYAVGYESPTQFSREYKRLFGAPPKRDVSA